VPDASIPSTTDVIDATGVSMSRELLFPNFSFDSVAAMRIVGASLTVTQTQRLVDRAGYGLQSRIYGLSDRFATHISKLSVLNATYKDETNFSSGEEAYLRMVYAPADFSDLHMTVQNRNDPPRPELDLQT